VAGKNFGYGHAHRQCMETIRQIGINTVLAESFAPGFFRAEVGNGMALLVVPDITKKVSPGDHLRADLESGLVTDVTTGESIPGAKPGGMILDLYRCGGNSGFLRKMMNDPAFQ
jgi:3-isopropylmalate/(R)-2-methylmalate dehydratase small subunit